MGAIAATGVTVGCRGAPVLTEVDLRIARGERVGPLGRSGSGKTSLLRVMAGLDRPAEGSIEVDGRPVRGMPEGVTMVFSDDTVYELEVGRRVDWSVPPVAMRLFDPVTGRALGPHPHTQGAHGSDPRES